VIYYKADNYTVKRVTEPSSEPITVTEAKENLRLGSDFTIDDTLIGTYISAARDMVENYLNRPVADGNYLITVDSLPTGDNLLYVPVFGLDSVVSASYIDTNGDSQDFSASSFTLDADYKTLEYTADDWPDAQRAKFTFSCTAPTVAIAAIKQAIKLAVADMYELREMQVVGTNISENQAFYALLSPYRQELGI